MILTRSLRFTSRFTDYFKSIDKLKGSATLDKASNVQSSPQRKMPPPPPRRPIPNIKQIILVASGKGGVGKSTVSVNLAVAMSKLGRKVALLDADVFGPSIPRLMGLTNQMARTTSSGLLIPLLNHGVHCMSMGFLLENEKDAMVWRGMMVMKALQQLMFGVAWHPETDVLVVDMPPGTGDTQLTTCQLLNIDGALIVTTPQDIALADARKGITMFRKVNVPILGLVQNMSHFVCPQCHTETPVFGKGGGDRLANDEGVKVLGNVPLHADICHDSDKGRPVVLARSGTSLASPYEEIAASVLSALDLKKQPER